MSDMTRTKAERDAAILAAFHAGKSAMAIQRELRVSDRTVRKVLKENNLTNPRSFANNWTDDRVAALREMWLADVPTQKIADEFGVARSSVCRKAVAIGLKPRPRNVVQTRRRAAPPRPLILTPEPPGLGLTLLELESGQCRWITTETGIDAHFCGHPTIEDHSYCQAHYERAYEPWRPRNVSNIRPFAA